MSVNLINSNDIDINQTNDDIELGFSSARQQELLDIKSDIENLQNFTSNISTCSTAEKVVGKWIDGKPIYRKTITYTVTGDTTTDISSLNIETVVDYNTICHRHGSNNSDWEKTFYNSTTDYFRSFIRTNTNTIETRITTSSAYTTYDITTTLYYTKTTD